MNDTLITFVCEAMFALAYYVAGWLATNSIIQCCINPLMAKYSNGLYSGTEKNVLLNQPHHIFLRNHT